jgi:hypothetical protein
MRKSWTDDRLDDMSKSIDRRFEQVDRRFEQVDGTIKELRREMNARFDSLQRLTLQTSGALLAAIIATQL